MITKDLELPVKPAEKTGWVGGSVFRMAATQAIRSFNVYELFSLLVILATCVSVIAGRHIDGGWYAFGIFVVTAALSARYFDLIRLETTKKPKE